MEQNPEVEEQTISTLPKAEGDNYMLRSRRRRPLLFVPGTSQDDQPIFNCLTISAAPLNDAGTEAPTVSAQ